MKHLAIALALTAASGATFAQAVVSGVTGLVTATSGNQLFNVTNGMTLPEGAQLQLTTGATATVSFPGGCMASLGSGQSMVLTQATCQTMAAAGGGSTILGMSTPLAVGGGVLGLGLLYQATKDDSPAPARPISPS